MGISWLISCLRECLMMEAETFCETSNFYSVSMQLITQEDSIVIVIFIASSKSLIFVYQLL
jgi:hypothetical protein